MVIIIEGVVIWEHVDASHAKRCSGILLTGPMEGEPAPRVNESTRETWKAAQEQVLREVLADCHACMFMCLFDLVFFLVLCRFELRRNTSLIDGNEAIFKHLIDPSIDYLL